MNDIPADRHYDDLETRSQEAREGSLLARLPELVADAMRDAPGWARQLKGVDPRSVVSRKALAALPVLRKGELKDLQQADPPFGGLTTVATGNLGHLFMSPGPIFDPEGTGPDPWRVVRALWAAGVRPGQVLQNCFSYHLTPGAWMIDHAARKLGCAVIPAGTGQTEQQIELIRTLRPDAYVGTPSFLRIIIEKAQELGLDISNLQRALLAAEALPASLRQWFQEQGVRTVLQWYGTADLGCIAYESDALDGMILEEDLLLEIVRPGTGEPLPDGEVGEIVITSFNPHYPMIRFGTGDLSAVMSGTSSCGRTNVRIRGWLGRADQVTKVRGLFVHPQQVAAALAGHPEVRRARLVVSGERADDRMTLLCETDLHEGASGSGNSADGVAGGSGDSASGGSGSDLARRIVESLRKTTSLRAEVRLVAPGSLPNDGKVIEDTRKLD
ncbi:MAG TPA: AMP-binding protein [Lautropia sp.]|nr:AMP-binding protein [Lautropia sp.]